MLNFITQHRRGTTEEWTSSTVIPEAGELIIEERKNLPVGIKIGDGIHKFIDLTYVDSETITKLNNLLQRYDQHIAYMEENETIPDSTLATEVLDARTVDGRTYDCLGEALQNLADQHIGSLVYDVEGTIGLHQPYYLYLTDKNGNILEDTGVQIVSASPGGGGGGGSSGSVLKIERVTSDPYILTVNDQPAIEFIFTGVDSSGETITQANATWRVDGLEVMRTFVKNGLNRADYLKDYLGVGIHKVLLIVSDDAGASVTKTWNVNIVDIRIESDFDSTQRFNTQHSVSFTYTPYGAINKEVHFILDGVKILPETETAVSGTSQSKTIPAQPHGSHYLEVYITADIEKVPGELPEHIRSNSIFKDLIFYDFDTEDVEPVIGTDIREFACKEYDTISIDYTVYSNIESPTVVISVTDEDGNEEVVATPQIKTPTNTYNFRSDVEGIYMINIACGNTVKRIKAIVEKLEIPEKPVTEGLAFDFNPVGKNNEFEDRLWTNGDVSMSVSDNFDWINGGYQKDEDNNVCFIVKAGSWAQFDYTELFSDTTKSAGREFKIVFKTTNIKKRDTSIVSCRSSKSGIGLDMRVESANIYSSIDHLYSPYCEEDIIEFEYNISNEIPLILTYEDGVANRPLIYTDSSTLTQGADRQPIKIGSADCDVYVYRLKVYNRGLSDREILSNFIRDARTAEEIANRSKRNAIYDDNNVLNPVVLAEKCPHLRVIMIEAPRFTYDKEDKVENTTVRMIYTNGRKNEDNWVCTGAKHSGQGTSSNEYGYAGRNLDLIMNTDTSLFTLNDGTETKKITLTDTSVPTDYLNIKVNIASSENANNAQMATRYNKYNPFKRVAKLKDPKVKDCMEFYNCVVFIKETGDVSQHQEFKDNEWHFYAIGNIGDSKKTDNTRVNDKEDPKECVVEILDWNLPLSSFPTGVDGICPPDQWGPGNTAYDSLYAPYKYKDGKFKSFGNASYEFRYEKKGITEGERQANIDAWRAFYTFLVTTPCETEEEIEQFKQGLDNYFVIDSALFYYLFTERYTMVDNRAKNSFWHYGKTYYTPAEAQSIKGLEEKYIDADKAAINDGYRWDLTFGYDFDTSLGIDNVGKLAISYGKEDVDYYDDDPKNGYIYRAAESTFFTRVRDLFTTELQSMYLDRESAGAWDATELINQWDDSQNLFPEELWRLDIQRKYIRTYLGTSIDNSLEGDATSRFLTEMLNGRKRYQRRMFERNQELYMATKYFGKLATANNIFIRLNNPQEYTDKFSPLFNFDIVPYSDMYIGVSFANGTTPVHFRAKQGQSYSVESPLSQGDITLIYGARFIQAISSLARCYVGDNDFSKATKLQSIVLGNTDDEYSNTFLSALSLESNPILEYLDVSNLKKLDNLKLGKCFNLKTLFAEGSACTSVEFATGGLLEKFYLPEITTLILRGLSSLTDYRVKSNRIQELIIEGTPKFDSYAFVSSANTLNRIRLIDIDWKMPEAYALTKLVHLNGFDIVGKPQDESVVTGVAHINNATGAEYKLLTDNYKELKLTFDALTSTVYFRDENENIVDQRTVYNPELAGTPVNSLGVSLKNIPQVILTKEDLTGQYEYKHSGWTTTKGSFEEQLDVFDNILGDRDVYPRFIPTVKTYLLQFFTGNKLIYSERLPYGSAIKYDPNVALQHASINNIVDENGNPLKQDTGSPLMYKFVAFLPNTSVITRDTSLYADFMLSLDNIIPATLSEFEYTQDDSLRTLSLNKYVAVPNDEQNDSDSITTVLEKYELYDESSLGEYTVTSVGGFNPSLEDVTIDVEIVQLPETLTKIQDEAFYNCRSLLRAEIPSNVTYLGKKAYANCTSLDEVQLDAENISNVVSAPSDAPFTGSGVANGFTVSVGNSVAIIPPYMFTGSRLRQLHWGTSPSCTTIKSFAFRGTTPVNMILPDSVKIIESYAFAENSNHLAISYEDEQQGTFKLSRTLEEVGLGAFDNWSNLISIKLPKTITRIDGAFAKYCPKLENIEIEPGSSRYMISSNSVVDTVSRKVIQGCNNSILLGGENGIIEIGDRAFEGCGIHVQDDTFLPDSLIKLGNYAFSHCDNITTIKVPKGVTTVPTQCFEHCSNLETVTLHDNIVQLGTYLFWNCSKLTNVHIPTSVTAIPGGCFNGCSSLENVELPLNLLTIDVAAFNNTAIKHVVLPDTVYHLSTEAYSNCKELESFTFGTGIQRIGGSNTNSSTLGTTPFAGCTKLSQINCPFSEDSVFAATAPWGASAPVVHVTYNYGTNNEKTIDYNS